MNGTIDVTFGALSTANGRVSPRFDAASTRACAGTYCHGGFPGGNVTNAPTWTTAAAGQAACGTCHAVPPPAPHPQRSACGDCHPGYTSTTVAAATHVNGTIEVAGLTCTSCHGDASRQPTPQNPQLAAAPPTDTRGSSAAGGRGVGAHQRHLAAGAITSGIACGECHPVPSSVLHADRVVDVRFGALATTGGAAPAWNGTSCAASYCHGAFKNGNTTYLPDWTHAAADACGTCHGLPPGGTHPQRSDCASCHQGYTSTTVNLATHVDGHVDVLPLACTSCHGDASRALVAGADPAVPIAPPVTATGRAPGAHLVHVDAAGGKMAPIACAVCHQGAMPASLANHPTGAGPVLAFGAAASQPTGDASVGPNPNEKVTWATPSASPSYDAATLTCSATYCHGNYSGAYSYFFFDGTDTVAITGARGSPRWTDGPMTCSSCHDNPPRNGVWHSGYHGAVSDNACSLCHPDVDAAGTKITVPALHVNGVVDVAPAFESRCFYCH
jgi:predicted CxxxxCH...CXXCH cytochrome family protein